MNLTRAFSIRAKDVVSIVGGGGKTSAMFRLAGELVAQGKCVVTTTTTRIFASQIRLAPYAIYAADAEQVLREVQAALAKHPHVLVIGTETQEGKALGVSPDLVDRIAALPEVDNVIVEADGSRMRPFKAPNEREPVIPSATTLLVPVVGMDVLDKPLDEVHVHRAELVSQRWGIPPGTTLAAEHIAKVIADAGGGLKNKPLAARAIPLLNKVESPAQAQAARNVATLLLENKNIDAVAVGALHDTDTPISARYTCVAGIILAAGGSTRMEGETKQLLAWGSGTLVRNAVRLTSQSHVSEMVLVTGNRAAEVEQEIATPDSPPSRTPLRVTRNPEWATGRASSVRVGMHAASEESAAAIFINADQPFLTAQVIDTILDTYYRTGAPIVVPTYQGKTGSPVLFARELFPELDALQADQGGREVLEKYRDVLVKVEIEDTRAAIDLDTPAEYHAARADHREDERGLGGVGE